MKFVKAVLALLIFSLLLFQYSENISLSRKSGDLEEEVAWLRESYEKLESDAAFARDRVAELSRDLENAEEELEQKDNLLGEAEEIIARLNYSSTLEIYTLGVRDEEGVPIPLRIEMKSGEGRLLIDTEGVLLESSVQSAAKTAFQVAQNISGADLSRKDIIFRIVNSFNETLVLSGESAGAAMTVGLAALVTGRQVKQGVVITGEINEDGSLGKVSQIEPKAEAAKRANATTLIVPSGQAVRIEGISVVEVSDIHEAMRYILL